MKHSLRATWNASKQALALALVLTAFVPVFAAGEEATTGITSAKEWLNPSGSLRLAYFGRDASFSGQTALLTGAAWLSIQPREFGGIRTFAEARLIAPNVRNRFNGLFDLREGYAETSLGALDVRLGRQINVWGRADKLNPTDSLTTKDLTLLTTDDEEQRLGIGSLQAIYNFGDLRLIGIWQAEWRTPNYPIPALTGIRLREQDPKDPWKQFAIKLDSSGGSVDWSVSYFNGYNRAPDLKPQTSGAGGLDIDLVHQRIQVWGADAATVIGPIGLRSEVAYTQTVDYAGSDPTTQNPFLYGVLGTEYSPFENVSVFGQYIYRHVFHHVDAASITDPSIAAVASQVALLSNQVFADSHGVSLRVGHKALHDTLESEVAFVGWFQGGGWLVRPKVSYSLDDRWRGIVGAQLFGGGEQTFFGRLSSLSSGFAEVRYIF